jgi:hypothetical protein
MDCFLQIYYQRIAPKHMSEEQQLEELINQTLDGTLSTIPIYLQEIEQNKAELHVENVREFVFGVIMGMSLGMASTAIAAMRNGMPSEEDQIKVRDIVYAKIPQIRERIYS